MLEGPLAIKEDLKRTLTANISQYRQDTRKQSGNPVTAQQIQYEAENEAVQNKTGILRYLDQVDDFWEERFRRTVMARKVQGLVGIDRAIKFVKACKDRGVPIEALKDCCVRATRTIGYGSAFNRIMALNRMFQRYALYPADGQRKLLEDVTAADVGISLMRRYVPEQDKQFQDEQVLASLQISAARHGVSPVVADNQNHVAMAEIFIQECVQAIASIEEGANPMEVLAFLNAVGPAIAKHIQYLANDPVHQKELKQFSQQLAEISAATDKITQKGQQVAQQMQQQQQQTVQAMSDEQLAQAKTQSDIQRKTAKANLDMQLKTAKTKQAMAIADVKTAQQLKAEQMSQNDQT